MMTIENTTGGMLNHDFFGIFGTSITPVYILITVIGILTLVLNGLLLIAMVQYRSTIFTSKGAYLIANLAIADLLTGLNSSLWGLQIAFRLPQALKKAMLSILLTSLEASFLTILVMSLERYIAIVFPLKAQIWLSKRRTIKSCVAVWFIAALCGVCMALSRLIVRFCFTILFEITVLVTIFFYYKIVIKLRQRDLDMQSTGARGSNLTTVVVFLVVIMIVTVLPYMLTLQIYLVRSMFMVANYDPKLQLFLYYSIPIQLMNFVLNPIVYAWRLPKYRLALLGTIHCH